ncbi:MAG: hypothetical protein ACR2N2_11665 [Acidimicrobiia bacterium]
MTRWEWLGPAIGATFYVTGLTAVLLAPIESVFFSFSDPVKFIITIVVATLATGLVARSLQKRRTKLKQAKVQLANWQPPEASP